MKTTLIALCFGLAACASAPEADIDIQPDDTAATAEIEKQLELLCPNNAYLSIQNRDTGEVLDTPILYRSSSGGSRG